MYTVVLYVIGKLVQTSTYKRQIINIKKHSLGDIFWWTPWCYAKSAAFSDLTKIAGV